MKKAGTVWDQTKSNGSDPSTVKSRILPKARVSFSCTSHSLNIWTSTTTTLSLATRERKCVVAQWTRGFSGRSRSSRQCSGSWRDMTTTTTTMARTKTSRSGSEGRLGSAGTGPIRLREGLACLKSLRNHMGLTHGSGKTGGLCTGRLSHIKGM